MTVNSDALFNSMCGTFRCISGLLPDGWELFHSNSALFSNLSGLFGNTSGMFPEQLEVFPNDPGWLRDLVGKFPNKSDLLPVIPDSVSNMPELFGNTSGMFPGIRALLLNEPGLLLRSAQVLCCGLMMRHAKTGKLPHAYAVTEGQGLLYKGP